ncbi:MAG TPA: multiheme c-type cytochrome [Desulfuromonadaceae bacterium]
MFRKSILTLIMLFTFPAFASAWYVNAKTSPVSGQGTILPAGNQTYASGVNSGEYTVAPATDYKVSRVTLDGVAISPNGNGKYVAPYVAGKTWRYIVAYFAANTVNITTSVTGSGAIREDTFESLINIPVGSARQLLIIPNPGYAISSVTAPGATITTNPDGSRTAEFKSLQTDQTVAAVFVLIPLVSASAGNDVTTNGEGVAYAATLYGSATSNQGAISYAWSGTGLSFGSSTSAITSVYADTAGIYTATLTVISNGITRTDDATVTVSNRIAYLENLCTQCHAGTHPTVVTAYDTGAHKTKKVSCQACHDPGNGGHYSLRNPGCGTCHNQKHGPTFPNCRGCHDPHSTGWISGGSISHSDMTPSDAICGSCHAPSPHYGGNTSNKAQYMFTGQICASCHANGDLKANRGLLIDYASTGHGNVAGVFGLFREIDNICQRCHTTRGFIASLSGTTVTFDSSDTNEVLACNACHSDVATGAVRAVTSPFTLPLSNGATVTYDVPGSSGLCVNCHGGRETGDSIKNDPDADGIRGFINSHYLVAGGTLYNKTGYEYAGQTYDILGYHKNIGLANTSSTGTAGPCVACHMSRGTGHTWGFLTRDANGVITSINSTLCGKCHLAGITASALQATKEQYQAALEVLKAQLAAKEIHFYNAYPYFYAAPYVAGATNTPFTNWAGVYGLSKWKDVMGAAFNFNMLQHEPGAYAHNKIYALKLISDSISFLYDGDVATNDTAVAIDALTSIPQTQRELVKQALNLDYLTQPKYVGTDKCASCHASQYATYINTGHNFVLSKIANGSEPTFPYNNITGALLGISDDTTSDTTFGPDPDNIPGKTDNALGTPATYAAISYVVGGYGWKANWIDADGYIITGSKTQYNLPTYYRPESWSAYNNNEYNKKYDCGGCHTTGWKQYDATLNPRHQDNLPGISGTWEEGRISCEACHGAGGKHAATANKTAIARIATPRTPDQLRQNDQGYGLAVACAECHTRDGEKLYTAIPPYNSKFIKAGGSGAGGRITANNSLGQNHQSYDELLGVDPDNIVAGGLGKKLKAGKSCSTCHDPHKTTKYLRGIGNMAGPGVDAWCTSCHTVTFTPKVARHVYPTCSECNCIRCHMPNLVKSAISTTSFGRPDGDMKAHIFKIDLTKPAQFTADGKFMYPWIIKDYACGFCHADASSTSGPASRLGGTGKVHETVTTVP